MFQRPPVPGDVLADMDEGEAVLRVAPALFVDQPDRTLGLPCVAVMTPDRLIVVPGAPGSPQGPRNEATAGGLLAALFGTVRAPRRDDAAERGRQSLAARARPGIDVPLGLVRSAFLARTSTSVGLELTLPLPDPRPPWALYLAMPSETEARAWVEEFEKRRPGARPMPELERPYAIYYLSRALPRPVVRLRGPQQRRGALTLAPDGPEIGGTRRLRLFPYESLQRLEWSAPTKLRKARLVMTVAEREWVLEPVAKHHAAGLLDVGHLMAEIVERPVDYAKGPLRLARLTAWAAGAGGGAAAIWELLF